jgi:hypothetical protein
MQYHVVISDGALLRNAFTHRISHSIDELSCAQYLPDAMGIFKENT